MEVTIESKINFLSTREINESGSTGIQAIIDKLTAIKHNPSFKQIKAVNEFASKLAVIDMNPVDSGANIRYMPRSGCWETYRQVNFKRFVKVSKDRQVCVDAYNQFCKENGVNA